MNKQYVVFNKEGNTYICDEAIENALFTTFNYNPDKAALFSNLTEIQEFSIKYNCSINVQEIMPLDVAKSYRPDMLRGYMFTDIDNGHQEIIDVNGYSSLNSDFIIYNGKIETMRYVDAFDQCQGINGKFNSTIITSNFYGEFGKHFYFNGFRFTKISQSSSKTGFMIENSDKSITEKISGFERTFEKYQENKELYKALELAKIYFSAPSTYPNSEYFEDMYSRDFLFYLNSGNDTAYLIEAETSKPILSFGSSSYMTVIGDINYLGKVNGIPETGLSFKHRNGQEYSKGVFKPKKLFEEYLEFELELSKLYVESKFPFDKD